MRLKDLDLIVTMIIAALNVVWVLVPSPIPVVGIILALPLVFVLPGYALTKLMFHKRSLDASHRLIFSFGLSLAIDILGGLILNLLPAGLHGISWAVLLGLLTMVFSLLVAYLRRGAPVNGTRSLRFRFSISNLVLFGLAIVVMVSSIAYDAVGVVREPHPGFTQLWMLQAVRAGEGCAVRLGVRSFESTPVTYSVTMTIEKAQAATWPSVVLAPQGEWDRLVPIPPMATDNVFVEVQLYRVDKPQAVYREVNMTLRSCPTLQAAPTRYPVLTSVYNGTIHDLLINIKTSLSLTGIEQSGGNINGHLTVGTGLKGSGAFRGMVTATKHIQFKVSDATGNAVLSFDGDVQPDGTLTGNYCGLGKAGQCSGDYGLWSVTPASS